MQEAFSRLMPATDYIASDANLPMSAPVYAGTFLSSEPSITTHNLQPGYGGIFQALAGMAQTVRGEIPPDFCGYQSKHVQSQARMLAAGYNSRQAKIEAIFNFVRDDIAYQLHPSNVQTIQDCQRTLEIGSGDCVSKSVCLASLLASIGIDCWFVVQAPDGSEYSHVYVECVGDDRNLIGLDPIANEPMGWRQPLPDMGFETTWTIF